MGFHVTWRQSIYGHANSDRQFRLDNGLLVTLSEDNTAPIVAVNLWYHVGSANERIGRTGFAHLFEHMLFQGSEHVGANEHFELVQRAGGTLNGSTWLERTNYFETVPSNQLALALWLEADRMGALLPAMTQKKLDTQRDVVKNERRWSVDNQPYGTLVGETPGARVPRPASLPSFAHRIDGGSQRGIARGCRAILRDVLHARQRGALHCRRLRVQKKPSAWSRITSGRFRAEAESRHSSEWNCPPTFGETLRLVVRRRCQSFAHCTWRFALRCSEATAIMPASVCGAMLGMRRGSRLYRSLVRERQIAADASAFTFDLAKGSDLLIVDVTARPETIARTARGRSGERNRHAAR